MNTDMKTEASAVDMVRANPLFNDPATVRGLESLLERISPLLQARRFENVVDVLSALADVVDMADNNMVEKLARDYENVAAGAFKINGVFRHAADQAAAADNPPSLWQMLRRINKDEDARRGLLVFVNMLTLFGRDARYMRSVMQADE